MLIYSVLNVVHRVLKEVEGCPEGVVVLGWHVDCLRRLYADHDGCGADRVVLSEDVAGAKINCKQVVTKCALLSLVGNLATWRLGDLSSSLLCLRSALCSVPQHHPHQLTMPPKVLLLRSLPPQGQSVLQSAAAADVITLIEWTRDSGADRAWVLTELRKGGVEGVICMLNDKVRLLFLGLGVLG